MHIFSQVLVLLTESFFLIKKGVIMLIKFLGIDFSLPYLIIAASYAVILAVYIKLAVSAH